MVYHLTIIVVVRAKLRKRVKIKLWALTLDIITNRGLVGESLKSDSGGEVTPSIDVKTIIAKWKVTV